VCIGANLHPVMVGELLRIARELEIRVQTEVQPGRTGTDAWAIQVTREGIPTALLSIPTRNMHTPIETLSVKDVVRTGRLMAQFIASLDETFLDKMAWKRKAAEEGESA
jgi:endoglucanase